jgi:hypothetical protein
MKYIFSLMILVCFAFSADAQYLYKAFDRDTITDTEADTLTWARAFTPANSIGCHCEYVELSGTAEVTQVLEGSQDNGTTWFQIDSDTIVSGVAAAEIYQFSSSATQTAARYRVRLTGSGTESLQYNCSMAVRRL